MNTAQHASATARFRAGPSVRDGGSLQSPAETGGSPGRDSSATLESFDATGGVVSGDELAALLRGGVDEPMSMLARWIVRRAVLHLPCTAGICLPKFQFDLARHSVRPGVRETIAALCGVFDDWELADWFTRPNNWIGNVSPAALIAADPNAVLHAARADRFVAMG